MVIWKYELKVMTHQRVEMPCGGEILSVGNQNDKICLWATVKPSVRVPSLMLVYEIEIRGTGEECTEEHGMGGQFLGTVMVGPHVWHVFARYIPTSS